MIRLLGSGWLAFQGLVSVHGSIRHFQQGVDNQQSSGLPTVIYSIDKVQTRYLDIKKPKRLAGCPASWVQFTDQFYLLDDLENHLIP